MDGYMYERTVVVKLVYPLYFVENACITILYKVNLSILKVNILIAICFVQFCYLCKPISLRHFKALQVPTKKLQLNLYRNGAFFKGASFYYGKILYLIRVV